MVDVYSGEPERQAALADLTALRRELKTETAAGAKAAASDPRFIAAKERLDAAKSAVGLRTSAQDLAALNKVDTQFATQGKTADQVTQRLNVRPKSYFGPGGALQQAYSNPDMVPTWKPPKSITLDDIQNAAVNGIDLSSARYDWVWYPGAKADGQVIFEDVPGKWVMGLVGSKMTAPTKAYSPGDDAWEYAFRSFASDNMTAKEWVDFVAQNNAFVDRSKATQSPFPVNVPPEDIALALPEITYSELQEIVYQLTLEKDNDITIEDILDKYDAIYGEG